MIGESLKFLPSLGDMANNIWDGKIVVFFA